jgi:hypothetical protein
MFTIQTRATLNTRSSGSLDTTRSTSPLDITGYHEINHSTLVSLSPGTRAHELNIHTGYQHVQG